MSFGFGIGDFIVVLELARAVRQRWTDAPGEYGAARNEIKSLENLLQDINELGNLDNGIISAAQKAKLHDVVLQCKIALIAANKVVDVYSTPSSNRLRKTWKRFKADPGDVRNVRAKLGFLISQLMTVQNNIQIELDRELQEGIQGIKFDLADERRLKIADWFSVPAFAQQQAAQLNLRQPGTAAWFLQHPAYQVWRDGSKQTLFCPGIAGSGKSIIFATAIDELQRHYEKDQDTVVAYFYCNYKRRTEQTLPLILGALTRQLFQEQLIIPQPVQEMYEQHVMTGSSPSVDELYSLMESLIGLYSKVLILVDALDECENDDEYRTRDKILSYLAQLQDQSKSQINIMTTCRSGVISNFINCPQIEIRAQEEDIKRYVSANVALFIPCTRNRQDLQTKVTEEIAKGVDGMFLLARLHLDYLQDKTKPRALLQALKHLRSDSRSAALKQAYGRVLERINQQRQGFKKLAQQTLAWVTLAKRELTMDELREALAIEANMADIDHENDLDEEDAITSVCAGLVTFDPVSRIVKLAHYTAQVYLERNQMSWLPGGSMEYVARCCITYLSMKTFYATGIQWGMDFRHQMEKYKLLRYVGQSWGVHVCALEEIPADLKTMLLNPDFQCFAAQLAFANQDPNIDSYRCTLNDLSPLHLAAYFDDFKVLKLWLHEGQDPNSIDSSRRSALHIAVTYGRYNATRFLLNNDNINPNLQDRNGETPLILASYLGFGELVSRLLVRTDIGLSLNLQDHWGCTPLSHAARVGDSDIIAKLLAREDIGPSINLPNKDDDTPLSFSSREGYATIISRLLARPDISPSVNLQNQYGDTPLSWAAREGHTEIAAQFLARHDIGPSINLANKYGNTPLSFASERGHVAIVRQLLSRQDIHESVNQQDNYQCTPLSWAARKGYKNVLGELLARQDIGPSLNMMDIFGDTPLCRAARKGDTEIVAQLLARQDIGPSVVLQNRTGDTALSWAARNGHSKIVALLLNQPNIAASLNLQNNGGHTPLSRAAREGHTEVVAQLLARPDVGPSVKLQDRQGETPLSRASRGEYSETVSRMLGQFGDSRVLESDEAE